MPPPTKVRLAIRRLAKTLCQTSPGPDACQAIRAAVQLLEKEKAGRAAPGRHRLWRPQEDSNLQPLAPEPVRSDNGPEFIDKEISRWLSSASVGTLYIQKASPWNGGVEGFNGGRRDELLNRELFLGLLAARDVPDEWCLEYTHRQPESGIRRGRSGRQGCSPRGRAGGDAGWSYGRGCVSPSGPASE